MQRHTKRTSVGDPGKQKHVLYTSSEWRVCVKGLEYGNVVGLYFLFFPPLFSSSVPTPWKTLSSTIHPASHDVDGRLTFARVCQ